ncbi:MAG: hypothetical protein CME04_04725 [Gemmatimonadaceae bacterium]|nr:hypothetical protein [Gemmatimonadaceae bacterium]
MPFGQSLAVGLQRSRDHRHRRLLLIGVGTDRQHVFEGLAHRVALFEAPLKHPLRKVVEAEALSGASGDNTAYRLWLEAETSCQGQHLRHGRHGHIIQDVVHHLGQLTTP